MVTVGADSIANYSWVVAEEGLAMERCKPRVRLGNSSREQLKKEALQWLKEAKKESLLWMKYFAGSMVGHHPPR